MELWINRVWIKRAQPVVYVINISDFLYAVGGYDGASRHCLSSVECYNPETDTWIAVSEMSCRRSGAGQNNKHEHLMIERVIYTRFYWKANCENKMILRFIFTVDLPNLSMLCICNRCRCAGWSPVRCWRAWWSSSQKECRDVLSRHKLMGTSCRHAPLQEKCRYELLKFRCK